MDNNKKALTMIMAFFESQEYQIQFMEHEHGNGVMISKDLYSVAFMITITTVHKVEMIKIEEINIDSNLKGQGIGTFIVSIILTIANICNAKVGLWTRGEPRLHEWYLKLGFKLIEISEVSGDYWYEKKPNSKHEQYLYKTLDSRGISGYKVFKKTSKEHFKILQKIDKE